MADEDKSSEHSQPSVQPPAESPPELPPSQAETASPAPTERAELLQRARAFLVSPQVKHEDSAAKRRFLADKGLTDAEIESLLYEVPPPAPPLPPRTYPQPPPSKVPYLLLDVLRAFTWIAGGSAALLLAYFRFLYPKIAQMYQARISLRSHRSALLERLTRSLGDLKEAQQSTFAILPQPELFREPTKYAECHGLDELISAAGDVQDVPPITLLRCAIEDCSKGERKATSPELFRVLEAKFPWIAEEGAQHEESLWRTLTTTPVFRAVDPAVPPTSPSSSSSPSPSPVPSPETIWTYASPTPPPPPPLLASLASLKSALPPPASSQPKFQHTFQALSDLTGYITTQTYALPTSFRAPGLGLGTSLSPEEEEVRREIRALKGLVLNRRSFMPRLPRPGSAGLPDASGVA
ncbi:hypothetical protein BD309DRAFT_877577 [Dichomitus squalens]|uniref:Peroxisome membrane anchor protein Pex14p N-terminal domain-containing protein n=2 Tax=Dichomitus squalens TaxID=114155 RepID=A0A4Q9Q6W7_9APHY|nr:uncharacterized protein DICSQDRAFT_161215 [Dichomitus squalens LYAD-421 SS1]EJF62407.1 hypothetical protein DICSQDRAFT_161215 [Dichomitus squalens LYAD-421 SS1]TBU36855.1 hypothetical protein BD309DRAFT_877577 [Dichomitus squalens]TBU63119.1 hypothetical protein BD310DRAFT_617957 [Dichomitus squalens]